MKKLTPFLCLLLATLLLAGCQTPKREKSLDETLRQYENMVRWSEWDGATSFIAPESLEENPITRLDLDRLRLFRVTNYTIRSATPTDGGDGFLQAVEIRMFNRNQAVERVVLDQQQWRYDTESERWLLHSGLPDVTRRY